MNATKASKSMGINIKNYPIHLLIPSIENVITFQAINYLNKESMFQFNFEGENLEIQIQDDIRDNVMFKPSEAKEFTISLIPTIDGHGKLIINVSSINQVKRKVKVKKIRPSVPKSTIDEIFQKYKLELTELIDQFNYEEYFVEMNIDEINQQNEKISGEKNAGLNVDDELKNIAKAWLTNKNIQKSLEACMQISDEHQKYLFYYDLIRAFSLVDIDMTIQILENLQDVNQKHALIKNISLEHVKINPEKASELVLLINEPNYKRKLLIELIGHSIKINTAIAYNLSHLINDEFTLAILLINIAKEYYETKNRPELVKTIRQILNIFIHSPKIDLSENKYRNRSYEFLQHVMQGMAEVEGPSIVNSIIEDLPDMELKNQIYKNLDDMIFEIKQETQTFFEPTPIFSQFFTFNTLFSLRNEDLTNFSSIGGNVSKNLIQKEYSFRTLIVSLFSFNFSIYPMMERVYSELNDVLAYYIFPSVSNHDEKEIKIINNTLNLLLNPTRISNQVTIYNLDFIPYLGRPTVIISSDSSQLHDKIKKVLGNSIEILIDNLLFQGGRSLENLKQVFPSNNFKISNLILSYEFINDYDIFKSLVHALT